MKYNVAKSNFKANIFQFRPKLTFLFIVPIHVKSEIKFSMYPVSIQLTDLCSTTQTNSNMSLNIIQQVKRLEFKNDIFLHVSKD